MLVELRPILLALPALVLPGGADESWIYFTSSESAEGVAPRLVLQLEDGERELEATRDSLLISYLAERVFGTNPRLSISLNDTNRVLAGFDVNVVSADTSIEKAELVLDMRLSEKPPGGSFFLVIHAVTGDWDEAETSWSSQPTFEDEPVLKTEITPQRGLISMEITKLVRDWCSGTRPNRGLLIKVSGAPSAQERATVPDLTFPYLESSIKKLPWPHQAPGLNRAQIKKLNREVWVINDFPLYQADAEGSNRYFHGGLDIVLDNGTPIYSMEQGWVKAIVGSSVIIARARDDRPCYGWSYSHLGDFEVSVGDHVARGTPLGVIKFHGLEHIHLSKVFSEGKHWGDWKYICPPYAHFDYTDEDPPIVQAPFHFFSNDGAGGENTRAFERDEHGRVVVRGKVDIVVGMRDAGLYAHAKDGGGFGDRLGVARIEYEIKGRGRSEHFNSFDFNRIRFLKGYYDKAYSTEITRVVFNHWKLFEDSRPHGSKLLSYYVITNHPRDSWIQELSAGARDYCWDTTEVHEGKPVFPDGVYEISVDAWDFMGNVASAKTEVEIRNDAK